MGLPKPYRDEPDPDAFSLHSTPADDDHTLASTSAPPPTYSDATTTGTPSVLSDDDALALTSAPDAAPVFDNGLQGISADPSTHFQTQSRAAWAKRARIHGEVLKYQDKRADGDPEYLAAWITRMARYAPSPYVHVRGMHREHRRDGDGKKKNQEVTDFRILISMQPFLLPGFNPAARNESELGTVENGVKTYRGSLRKVRAPGARGDIEVGELAPGLKEWCHRYCASSTSNKVFRLTRTVTGFDEELVRARLEGIIRSTNYKGHITIEFPTADRAVDIYSSSLLNKWRLNVWVWWIFVILFLWIFSWPILYFSTRRYHVVQVEWPFSKVDAQGRKRYTTVSEEQWIDKFGVAVRQLCLDRYQGMAGIDYLTQVLARPETHQPVPVNFRAQAAVGAAVGAMRGGFNAVNQVNNMLRFAGGSNDPLGWGYDT